MSKKFKPFLAHSELTDCIYIIDGNDKYEVTEQCIKAMKATNRMPNVLDKLKTEIKEKIEQEEFARSVFRHEEKDTFKDEQCTGSIMAYKNVIKFIDKYMAEGSDKE